MNIKFYTLKFKAKDGEHTRASRRFRAIIPLKGMRKNDGQIEDLDKATRDDIIVLAKDTSIKDAQFLLDNKIKSITVLFGHTVVLLTISTDRGLK